MENQPLEPERDPEREIMIPARAEKPTAPLLSGTVLRRLSLSDLSAMREELFLEAYRRAVRRARERVGPDPADVETVWGLILNQRPLADALLQNIRERHDELKALLESVSDSPGYADPIYRMYHFSFKVYRLQGVTLEIVAALQSLMPELALNRMLREIVSLGTGEPFEEHHNRDWLVHTLPITAAFFHARFFLEMAVRCGERYDRVTDLLPSDLAALLYLFDLR